MLTEADFHGPYIDPKTGYEYENFGSWFAREAPLGNDRNARVARERAHAAINEKFRAIYDSIVYNAITRPGSSAAGSGAAGPVQAPSDPVYAPDQPALPGRVGA